MDTVADLVAAGRERDGVAIDAPNRATPYSYGEFCTNTWKAGNLLGHYTHPGGTLVGATVDLSPDPPVDADTLVRLTGAA
jgi:hypothetical protein